MTAAAYDYIRDLSTVCVLVCDPLIKMGVRRQNKVGILVGLGISLPKQNGQRLKLTSARGWAEVRVAAFPEVSCSGVRRIMEGEH
jgi:hypothetical protein